MQTSRANASHLLLLAVLLSANGLLFLAWPWLREVPVQGDSEDTPLASPGPRIRPQVVMRNTAYMAGFSEVLRAERRILLLGTSESQYRDNVGAQLNHLAPDHPRIVVQAIAGGSPIHLCVALANCQRNGVEFPPTILVVNLVYFTESHDVIKDGWLSNAMPPVFVQMNHGNVADHLGEQVQAVYARHFFLKRVLYPATAQAYLGDLLYLRFHRPNSETVSTAEVPVPVYEFDGRVPEYDEARAVPVGYQATDRLAKGRWLVKPADESVNRKGIEASVRIVRELAAPLLVLVLPMNRKFYGHNGLNMIEYDKGFAEIRDRILCCAARENAYVIDLYENPKLDMGFRDRMHLDAYGNYQIAEHLVGCKEYTRFLKAVRDYYGGPWLEATVAYGPSNAVHREQSAEQPTKR